MDSHAFAFDLNVNGSSTFRILPLGKQTTMKLRSTRGKPSFSGAFLPDAREVNDTGFVASWKVLDLNRNIPPAWLGGLAEIRNSEFGVDLRVPVDNYQESDRATKYAAMFIGLTFLTFFLIEVLSQIRLHPIQYLLVGLALVIFYLLLLSLSEQMSFGLAYSIASAAVVLLATSYIGAVLTSKVMTALVGGIFALLYSYLYVLLQLEDWSLLIGSLGHFAILAAVMYLTRKIDWYTLKEKGKPVDTESVSAVG
jgi:inner membrane protein